MGQEQVGHVEARDEQDHGHGAHQQHEGTPDRARDGGSFSNRRVVAIQHGRPILNLAASFQTPERGVEHHDEMPDVPGPDGLPDLFDVPKEQIDRVPMKMRRFLTERRPFEFRPVETVNFAAPVREPPVKHRWIRAVDRLPDDRALHQNLLAYVSDYELLGASVLPHGLTFVSGGLIIARLGHAPWFHAEFRMDAWLLYAIDSPNAGGARGYSRGRFFTEDGRLVASTAQEGLIRVVEPDAREPRSDPHLQV